MSIKAKGNRFKTTLPVRLLVAGLVLLCINPGLTQGHSNMNVLLNGAMCLSPLVLLFKQARIFIPRIDLPMLLMIAGITLQPIVFHPESVRWSTMLFTTSYAVFFMMIARLTRLSDITVILLCRLIKWIVYAFAIVLVIQQMCVLFGLPVFLRAMVYQNPWKLNSLTAEPSHTTLILTILMYFFAQIRREGDDRFSLIGSLKAFPWMWVSYLYVILTTVNASAILIGPLCLVPYINRRNWGWYAGVGILAICLIGLLPDTYQTGRVKRTIESIGTLNDSIIIAADESAAGRVVPTLRGATVMTPFSIESLTGHGVDADQADTEPVPGMLNSRGHAGVFSMWYNYGLLATLSLWYAIGIVTIIGRKWWTYLTFLIAIFLSGTYNVQFVWMLMAFSMVYKSRICGHGRLLSTLR